MTSTTDQTTLLEKAQAIVPTGDTHALELVQRMLQMDDDSIVNLAGTVRRILAKERAQYEAAIADDLLVLRFADAVMLSRIKERGATAIPHDDYDVHITRSKTIEKRINVLRQLEGKVPDDELRKGLYLTNPQPEWKADARVLGTLSRKYGGEIAQIINNGLVENYGAPVLVFEPREQTKNVTPAELAS